MDYFHIEPKYRNRTNGNESNNNNNKENEIHYIYAMKLECDKFFFFMAPGVDDK